MIIDTIGKIDSKSIRLFKMIEFCFTNFKKSIFILDHLLRMLFVFFISWEFILAILDLFRNIAVKFSSTLISLLKHLSVFLTQNAKVQVSTLLFLQSAINTCGIKEEETDAGNQDEESKQGFCSVVPSV